jgi:hypothetical protein
MLPSSPLIGAVATDLIALVSPRLHLCGHHHRFVEMERAGVPSICLDRVNRSYLLIEAPGFAWRLVKQAGAAGP